MKHFLNLFFPLFWVSNRLNVQKLRRWFVANCINILGVLLTVYFLFIGVYGRVFTDNFPEKWWNVREHIKFFENQTKDSIYNISVDEDKSEYSHLFIIDRTQSTSEKNTDNRELEKYLKESFKNNKIIIAGIEDTTLKNLVIIQLYNFLYKSRSAKYLRVIYYDNRNTFNEFSYSPQQEKTIIIPNVLEKEKWMNLNENDQSNFIINKLAEQKATVQESRQKTFIKDIFQKIDTIKSEERENLIITLITDFVDDGEEYGEEITNAVIEQCMQSGKSKPVQINIINLLQDAQKEKDSERLVQKLYDKLHGTGQHILQTKTYDDWNRDKYHSFENNLIQFFSSFQNFNKNNSVIKLSFPEQDTAQIYKVARVGVRMEVACAEKDTCWEWRIGTPYNQEITPTAIFYRTRNDEYSNVRVDDNIWHKMNTADTLFLEFPLSRVINTNQYELQITCGEKSRNFQICFEERLPKSIATISIYLVHAFMIFLFILIILLASFSIAVMRRFYLAQQMNILLKRSLFWRYIYSLVVYGIIGSYIGFVYLPVLSKYIFIIFEIILIYCFVFMILVHDKNSILFHNHLIINEI
jgi:hypothetical protein